MEQRSNRHLFKLLLDCPVGQSTPSFLSQRLSHLFTMMNTSFPQLKHCLPWINLNSSWTDYGTRYLCFISIYFVVFRERHTIFNPATCLVNLHYKQIFISPSGPKVLIQDSMIYLFKYFKNLKLSLSIFHDHQSLTNFPSCHFILILQSNVICTLSLKDYYITLRIRADNYLPNLFNVLKQQIEGILVLTD